MRKKLIAGAAVLALLMNAPQVKAEDDIVVFGGEFDENKTPAPKPIKKPEPIRELPPEEEPEPIEEPEVEEPTPPPPVEEPEVIEPPDIPPTRPLEEDEPPAQEVSVNPPKEEDDNNFGDDLVFDDLNQLPEQNPVKQPTDTQIDEEPAQVDEPFVEPKPVEEPMVEREPVEEPVTEPTEIERPFEQPRKIASEEPVIVVPPTPEFTPPQPITPPPPSVVTIEEPREQPARRTTPRQSTTRQSTPRRTQPQKDLKMLPTRFFKLAVDDTYTYYLDKNSVQWVKMPYSTSEYIADVWIRMVEREPQNLDDDMAYYGEENYNAEISLAQEQGYQYSPEDMQVLKSQGYVLEHYYLRPKTRQVQFLCELEVFGRPQNTISERAYDYKNWENLVPGSVESVIYEATIKIIGKYKSTERGHMTFIDMLEEYGRISLR